MPKENEDFFRLWIRRYRYRKRPFSQNRISGLSSSLCEIYNLSIETGVFPDSWKEARVAPIFKSGKADDRSNYRPISVLPVVSRLFEKLIYDQL